jgi:hypothetical protein
MSTSISPTLVTSPPVYAPVDRSLPGTPAPAAAADPDEAHQSTYAFFQDAAAGIERMQHSFVGPHQDALANYVAFFKKLNDALLPLKDAISGGDNNKLKIDFTIVRKNLLDLAAAPQDQKLATGFATEEAAAKFLGDAGLNKTDFAITTYFDSAHGWQYSIELPRQQVVAIAQTMGQYNKTLYSFDTMTREQRVAFLAAIKDGFPSPQSIIFNAQLFGDKVPLASRFIPSSADISAAADNKEAYNRVVAGVRRVLIQFHDVKYIQNDFHALQDKYGGPDYTSPKPDVVQEWDNAKYNAWLASKDSIMQQLQQYSQFLTERLGHVNDLFNSIVRVLSGSISDTNESDRSFLSSL